MIPIILFGERKNSEFLDSLKSALSKNGGYTYYNSEILSQQKQSGESKFLILEANKTQTIEIKNAIFIFCGLIDNLSMPIIPKGVTTIFDSQNMKAARLLEHTGAVAVTCGMSVRDTINLASIDENCAVVSVQRDMISLNNEVLDQRDIKVCFGERIATYPLLAITSILVLTDEHKKDIYYL